MNFARHKKISNDRSLEVPLHGMPEVAEEPVQWPQDAHCCEFSFVFPGLSQTFLLIGYFFIGCLFDWFFDSDSQPKQVLDSDTTMAILFPSSTPVIFLFLYYKLSDVFFPLLPLQYLDLLQVLDRRVPFIIYFWPSVPFPSQFRESNAFTSWFRKFKTDYGLWIMNSHVIMDTFCNAIGCYA
jgi:hypothetical protein